jgi:ABC-type transport system involved in cytochrome c biogenesis permease component
MSNSFYKSLVLRETLMVKYTFNELVLSFLSCLVTFLVFLLVFNNTLLSDDSMKFYGLILIITTLTVSFSDHSSIQNDFRSGLLEQLFLLPISPFIIILIKFLISSLKYIVFHSILWVVMYEVFDHMSFSTVFFNYCLFTSQLMSVSLLISSISLGIEQHKNIFSTILVVPLIFPQIILSLLSASNPIYIYLMLSLSILMTPIFIIFSTIAIQNAVGSNS